MDTNQANILVCDDEVEVADLDEALRMVKTWPGCPVVEIRPLES